MSVFIEITRVETGKGGTFGVLTLNKQILCLTLEPPKKNNAKGLSCIPTGQYDCEKYHSEKYNRECLRVLNVPGRSYISFHVGNTIEDTRGCILTGVYPGVLNGKRAVMRSKAALDVLVSEIKDVCHLTIREVI